MDSRPELITPCQVVNKSKSEEEGAERLTSVRGGTKIVAEPPLLIVPTFPLKLYVTDPPWPEEIVNPGKKVATSVIGEFNINDLLEEFPE